MLKIQYDCKEEYEWYKQNDEINVNLSSSVYSIPIVGTIFGYAQIYSNLINAVEKKPSAILLNIHSNGGTTTNLINLLNLIDRINEIIPIYTYIHTAHSAAFVIALAGRKVYASNTATLGGFGVMAWSESENENGAFLTSQYAKNKNKDQTESIQDILNEIEFALITKIKKYRNLPDDNFLVNWKSGGVFGSKYAVAYNATDFILEYDEALEDIHNRLKLPSLGFYDLFHSNRLTKQDVVKSPKSKEESESLASTNTIDITASDHHQNIDAQRRTLIAESNSTEIIWGEV
jgi:ClpP class serine protease